MPSPSPGPSRLTALIVLGLLVTGCGSSSSSTKAGSTAPPSQAGTSPTPTSSPSGATGSTPGAAAGTGQASGTVTVFAAASLTKAFTEIGTAFRAAHPGSHVRFSFGPSSGLAQQILAGAPADVFASASPKNMSQVTAAGQATKVATFADNVAEIAVSPGSAAKVRSVSDLANGGVKVALCQPQVPCGVLAMKVLTKAEISVRPVTQGLDVKSTLAYVTSGQADAALVYVTDVKAAGAKVVGVPIPAAENASTAYQIGIVKGGRQPALAAAFEQFVLSAAGRQSLAKAGFQQP